MDDSDGCKRGGRRGGRRVDGWIQSGSVGVGTWRPWVSDGERRVGWGAIAADDDGSRG